MNLKADRISFIINTLVIVIVIAELFPVWWMILTSIRPQEEWFSILPWTLKPKLDFYVEVLFGTKYSTELYPRHLLNSIIYSVGSALLTLFVSSLAAYALARLKFFGKKFVSRSILFTYLFPSSILSISLFDLMSSYNLLDNPLSVILTMSTFTSPFCTWVLREYINSSIPVAIDEAAFIDGASKLKVFSGIIIPLCAPNIVSLGMYSFLTTWNEYLYIMIYMSKKTMFTVPITITLAMAGDQIIWGQVMAMAVLYSVIPVTIYYAFEKYLVKGFLSGAVKA